MITFITTVYNDYIGLRETINSLLKQKQTNWKHIIIDNFSKDIEWNLSYFKDERVSILQKKCSLYEGMNLGICNVDTPYFMIINAGTTFVDTCVLSKLTNNCESWPGLDLYVYSCLTDDNRKMEQKYLRPKIFPATLNHEALVYNNNVKILHNYLKYGMASDVQFITFYLIKKKIKIFATESTIIYKRGGASDRYSFLLKSKDHLIVAFYLLSKKMFRATIWYLHRAIKDIILHLIHK